VPHTFTWPYLELSTSWLYQMIGGAGDPGVPTVPDSTSACRAGVYFRARQCYSS
jgi:hypothetical protein